MFARRSQGNWTSPYKVTTRFCLNDFTTIEFCPLPGPLQVRLCRFLHWSSTCSDTLLYRYWRPDDSYWQHGCRPWQGLHRRRQQQGDHQWVSCASTHSKLTLTLYLFRLSATLASASAGATSILLPPVRCPPRHCRIPLRLCARRAALNTLHSHHPLLRMILPQAATLCTNRSAAHAPRKRTPLTVPPRQPERSRGRQRRQGQGVPPRRPTPPPPLPPHTHKPAKTYIIRDTLPSPFPVKLEPARAINYM